MAQIKYKKPSENFKTMTLNNVISEISNEALRNNKATEVLQIGIENILPYEKQSRRVFNESELYNLSLSMKEVGITSPLLIAKSQEHGKFYVINGERRLRAAKMIGLQKVPCIITDHHNKTELIAVIDNIQRSDLHPIELAQAYQSLVKNHGDKKDISDKVGVSYTSFLEVLKLNTLPDEIQTYLLDKNIKQRDLFRQLLKCNSLEEMKSYLSISGAPNNLEKKKKLPLLNISIRDGEVNIIFKNPSISKENGRELVMQLKKIIKQIEKNFEDKNF